MADLLSAASLLLTVLTILYSLWHPDISTASGLPVDHFAANRHVVYRRARSVFFSKALPLCLATGVLFAAALPQAIVILRRPIARSFATYDAVSTIFVAVTCVLLFLSAHILYNAVSLAKRVYRLSPNRGDS